MHTIVAIVDGKPVRVGRAGVHNALRGYYTFDFTTPAPDPFDLCARPITLTIAGGLGEPLTLAGAGAPLTVVGYTRGYKVGLTGHSAVGLADVAPRSRHFPD